MTRWDLAHGAVNALVVGAVWGVALAVTGMEINIVGLAVMSGIAYAFGRRDGRLAVAA